MIDRLTYKVKYQENMQRIGMRNCYFIVIIFIAKSILNADDKRPQRYHKILRL